MDAAVRAGAPGKSESLPKEDAECLFHLLLDGIGILLDLESAIVISFISQFEKISGH